MYAYLDNASTRKLSIDTIEYIENNLLCLYGNPSSTHDVGAKVKDMIFDARDSVATFINAESNDIYFTSGGCASNTLAIKGYCDANENTAVFYSPIAHKSIIECVKSIDESIKLSVDNFGTIRVDDLENKLSSSKAKNKLVVIDAANSEIGTCQDIEKITSIAHNNNAIVYFDCTGYLPYIKLDVTLYDIDMIGFSAHKFGALKGCGVLYKKPNIKLSPIVFGSQEGGLFGGTENTIGILTLGYVLDNYQYKHKDILERSNMIIDDILRRLKGVRILGSMFNRLPGNIALMFNAVDADKLAMMLNINGIYVSTGSACNLGNKENSVVLKELGYEDRVKNGFIRITLDGDETLEQIKYVCDTIVKTVNDLRWLCGE